MSVSSIELLRFILSLLGDPGKAEAFNDDPSGALSVAGLSDISCADVDAIAPLIANSVPGAVAIAKVGGGGWGAAEPTSMIKEIVHNVAVSTFDNSGVIQNIWGANEVRQAFASEGGLAIGGDLFAVDPVIVGDGNVVATDHAQAAGRDVIQNNGDGNLALGSEQTIAQDHGVIAGGDSMAGGDKVGGNNNEAPNTGNDNSVSMGDISVDLSKDQSTTVGGNQYNAENTGNTTLHDQSTTVGGNQNNAENTGNATYHDESVGDITIDKSDRSDNSVGDITIDKSDRSDNSTTVGGNQNNADNTGNATIHDESVSVGDIDLSDHFDNSTSIGDITIDKSDDHSIGGDNWEGGSNIGGIGNTDSRNSNNTVDSGNTVVLTKVDDNSLNVGTIAVDLSDDNSVKTGDIIHDDSVTVGDVDLSQDHSTTVGDVTVDTSDDHSISTGDIVHDDSITVGDIDLSEETTTVNYVDDSVNVGDVGLTHQEANVSYTYDDHSVGGNVYETGGGSSYGGDYYEQGSGNTVGVDTDVTVVTKTDYDFEYEGGH